MTPQTADQPAPLKSKTEILRITIVAAGISEKDRKLLDYWLFGRNYTFRSAAEHSLPPAEGVVYLGADAALIQFLSSWNLPFLCVTGSLISPEFLKNNLYKGLGPVWQIPENPDIIYFPELVSESSGKCTILSVSDPGIRMLMRQILLFNRMNPRSDLKNAADILAAVKASSPETEWNLILDMNSEETDVMQLVTGLTSAAKTRPDLRTRIKILFINNFRRSGHRLPLTASHLSQWSRRIFQPEEALIALLITMPSEEFLFSQKPPGISEMLIQGLLTVQSFLQEQQNSVNCRKSLFQHLYQEFKADSLPSGITLT